MNLEVGISTLWGAALGFNYYNSSYGFSGDVTEHELQIFLIFWCVSIYWESED